MGKPGMISILLRNNQKANSVTLLLLQILQVIFILLTLTIVLRLSLFNLDWLNSCLQVNRIINYTLHIGKSCYYYLYYLQLGRPYIQCSNAPCNSACSLQLIACSLYKILFETGIKYIQTTELSYYGTII